MNSLSDLESGASKARLSYEVADLDSHQDDASLTTAIYAINAAGSALTPETHLFGRLSFFSQVQQVLLEERLDRAYSVYKRIPQGEILQEVRGLAKTLKNLETIEEFLIARDKLVVWQAVATQSGVHEGRPDVAELNSLGDYLAKAAEFGDWLEGQPQARGIRELVIEGDYLSSIPPEIGRLTQLRSLHLGYNQIQKIEGLETLTQLNGLYLSNNQIQKIEGLETLTQLEELYLGANQIQKIEGLESLTQLRQLGLSNNQVQKVEGLENLTQLERLFLNQNQIQRIEGLENLTQLERLDLGYNQIQRIEGLETLTQLKDLYFDRNQIRKIEGVEHLPDLNLILVGNPVNSRFGCNIL